MTEIASLTRFGDAPFFVFCDHASNTIPEDLNCLGMPEDLLRTHIAWDIGAGPLAALLAEKLNGTLFHCCFSRLIVDPNRALTASDSIPGTSDQIPVPGNQMMDEHERRARIERFHVPYHDRLDQALDETVKLVGAPFVVAVHSFTNRLMGSAEDRPWHTGILWREDEESARAIIRRLKNTTDWRIGDNEPYDAREFNYSVDRHIGPRNLSHITVEVRQDLLDDDRGVADVADILAGGVRAVAS